MFTFTEAQQIYVDKWVRSQAERFLLEKKAVKEQEAEARRLRRFTGDCDDDDDDDAEDDDEARIAQAFELMKSEVETLLPDYLEIYGGEKFKSFIAQDISVLRDHYPDLILNAQMRLNTTNERKAQKKRKMDTESAGAGASSSAVGNNANELVRENSNLKWLVSKYKEHALFAKNRQLYYQTEMWLARDQCERAESKTAELYRENAELKQKIKELLGKEPGLSEPELEQLLVIQQDAQNRTVKKLCKFEATKKLESNSRFVCNITGALMSDPVVALDGYTYERTAIKRWMQEELVANEYNNNKGKWKSPLNGNYYEKTNLVPNNDKKSEIIEKLETTIDEMVANRRVV
jgi:hypothetical protein